MRTAFIPAPNAYEIVAGNSACDHVGSQIIQYESPTTTHTVWSCPRCHRIVRQDWTRWPERKGQWTAPRVLIPQGLEGVETPNGRQWKMPEADPLPRRRRFWS